jgi:hypothetical protein
MKTLRIYNGESMKFEIDIVCPSSILAVEFLPDKNSIAVSISNR